MPLKPEEAIAEGISQIRLGENLVIESEGRPQVAGFSQFPVSVSGEHPGIELGRVLGFEENLEIGDSLPGSPINLAVGEEKSGIGSKSPSSINYLLKKNFRFLVRVASSNLLGGSCGVIECGLLNYGVVGGRGDFLKSALSLPKVAIMEICLRQF